MSSGLRIVHPGAWSTIQDAGRFGLRRLGVPWCGVLDPRAQRLSNALVGNSPAAPVIECLGGGLRLRAEEMALRLAVLPSWCGEADDPPPCGEIRGAERSLRVSGGRSFTLQPGEEFRLAALRLASVAVAGLRLVQVLGSAASDVRAGFGGATGRGGPLQAGDLLSIEAFELTLRKAKAAERVLPRPPSWPTTPIRVVPGPQTEVFSAACTRQFFAATWWIGEHADRMGARLCGPQTLSDFAGDAGLLSDVSVPGSIQVPSNGQPIVLLVDAQTVGGYPKIATVISADLPRFAALSPGQPFRFTPVTVEAAEALARASEIETRALEQAIVAHDEDLQARLRTMNLVSGVVDGLAGRAGD